MRLRVCGCVCVCVRVCEQGLMLRAGEARYGIRDLLTLSSVCGIGLDTVPIAGDSPPQRICSLLTDVCALAFKVRRWAWRGSRWMLL